MNVHLAQGLQKRIFEQLQAAYPHEAGGFLLGTFERDDLHIVEAVAIENTFAIEERHHRYAMTPADWSRLEDEADARGLTLIGYYHSHPNAPAIPSEYDREHALPHFTYLIASVVPDSGEPRAVDLRAWQLKADRSGFEPLALAIKQRR